MQPLSVRRRHDGQEGCWDAALSTPTAAEGGGRRPAFTKPHPNSDNYPSRSRGLLCSKPSRCTGTAHLSAQFGGAMVMVLLHQRPRGEEQGWRMKALPRSL